MTPISSLLSKSIARERSKRGPKRPAAPRKPDAGARSAAKSTRDRPLRPAYVLQAALEEAQEVAADLRARLDRALGDAKVTEELLSAYEEQRQTIAMLSQQLSDKKEIIRRLVS